ncbi:MAG: hypothetical protein ACREXU_01725 [Gammaproteobacteria bacterium]
MGRPRRYGSGAERQRAFRQRQEAETVRVERRALEGLHGRLEALQEAMRAAARVGNPTAQHCRAISTETMLEKLIRHFEAEAREKAGVGQENKRER